MDLGHFLRHDLYFRCGKKVKSMVNLTYQSSTLLRLFQHTELEHTPSNLYQQVFFAGIPFIIGVYWGIAGFGCAISGVCCNFLGTLTSKSR